MPVKQKTHVFNLAFKHPLPNTPPPPLSPTGKPRPLPTCSVDVCFALGPDLGGLVGTSFKVAANLLSNLTGTSVTGLSSLYSATSFSAAATLLSGATANQKALASTLNTAAGVNFAATAVDISAGINLCTNILINSRHVGFGQVRAMLLMLFQTVGLGFIPYKDGRYTGRNPGQRNTLLFLSASSPIGI